MNAFGGKQGKATTGPLDPASLLQQSRALARAEVGHAQESKMPLAHLVPNPDQPRKHFDPDSLQELAASIREKGVLQPLMVRPISDHRFEIVFGERRYRAAQIAGLTEVPVIVRPMTTQERDVVSAVENLQRKDLSKFEEADSKLRLIATTLQTEAQDVPDLLKACRARPNEYASEIAALESLFAQLGREQWKSFVTNKLPVLNLPEPLLSSVRRGALDYTKAVLIARAPQEQHATLLSRALNEEWSQDQVQQAVRALKPKPATHETALRNIRQKLSVQRVNKLDQDKQDRLQGLLRELDSLLSTV